MQEVDDSWTLQIQSFQMISIVKAELFQMEELQTGNARSNHY